MREVYQSNEDTNVGRRHARREGQRGSESDAWQPPSRRRSTPSWGRDRYERSEEFRGYRNGYHRSRELTVGVSAVEVKVPRVSDVPAEVSSDGYSSGIVRRYERSSRQTQELFGKLYMEGLSTGDFEPVFRELVGETTALSANAIVRLKSRWEDEYRSWRCRPPRLSAGTPTYGLTVFTWEPAGIERRQRCCAWLERERTGRRSLWGWS